MANTVALLLPAGSRFGGQRLSEGSARWLGRADVIAAAAGAAEPGDVGARLFQVLPRGWPVAAVSRQRDAGDAADGQWLRADPVHVMPDINGARLMAHGEALGLTAADAEALLASLRPLFGDSGFPIDAPHPWRWYLQVPPGATLPAFTSPAQALGADLLDHLPQGAEGRRWRALLNETQVVLHNHPLNAARSARGQAPVNSLWFWGAGRLPDQVRTGFDAIASDDDAIRAFAELAGAGSESLPGRWTAGEGARAFDLRHLRDLRELDRDWLAPALAALESGALSRVDLELADGRVHRIARAHRWRFWRRPSLRFGPGAESGA